MKRKFIILIFIAIGSLVFFNFAYATNPAGYDPTNGMNNSFPSYTNGFYECDKVTEGTKDCYFQPQGPATDVNQTYWANIFSQAHDSEGDNTANITIELCFTQFIWNGGTPQGAAACYVLYQNQSTYNGWIGTQDKKMTLGNLGPSNYASLHVRVDHSTSTTQVLAYGRHVTSTENGAYFVGAGSDGHTLDWFIPNAQDGTIEIKGPKGFDSAGHSNGQQITAPSAGTYTLTAVGPYSAGQGGSIKVSISTIISDVTPHYSCTNNQCVNDPNGNYSDITSCQSTCGGGGPPPPPPPSGSGTITCNGTRGSCTVTIGNPAVFKWQTSGYTGCEVDPFHFNDPFNIWTGTSGQASDSSNINHIVKLECWNSSVDQVDSLTETWVSAPPPPGGGAETGLGCQNNNDGGDNWQSSCSYPTNSTLYQVGASCQSGIERIWTGQINKPLNDYLCNEDWNPGSCGTTGVDGWNRFFNQTIQYSDGRQYQLECLDGSTTGLVKVSVNAPSANIKANNSDGPITVKSGDSVGLSWTSNNVDTCAGSWAGNEPTSGTATVKPTATTVYTITCVNTPYSITVQDQVTVNVTAAPPNAPTNVSETDPDYCVSGPAATINWVYSDPAGSPQSAKEIQISNTGNFNNPFFDSGKVPSSTNSYFTGQGVLQFNTTYKARVKVWNSYDVVSAWSDSSNSWKTPSYAYPQADFSWTANGVLNNPSPPLNKPVQFTDQTVFSDGKTNGHKWSWILGDGGTSTAQNPSHTYTTEGSYYVTLTATDNANQVCSRTHGPLIIQKPIPQWREIAPH